MFVCSLVLCIDLCNRHYNQDTELFYNRRRTPLCYLIVFINSPPLLTPLLHPCPLVTTDLLFMSIVISRMLYKWNPTAYNLWDWSFYLNIMPLRTSQIVVGIKRSFLFVADYCSVVCIRLCSFIPQMRYSWVVSYFLLLQINLCTGFLHELKFSFSSHKCLRVWVMGHVVNVYLIF